MYNKNYNLIPMMILILAVHSGCSSFTHPLMKDVALVSPYLDNFNGNGLAFDAGSYKDGSAIVCGISERAFWVKKGVAYSVNDEAKQAAPNLPHAPEHIVYNDEFIDAASN